MRTFVGVIVLGSMLVACTSNTDGQGDCGDISGNYSVTSTRTSGSCDASMDGDGQSNVTFMKNGDGWTAVLPGIDGGCPGKLDAKTCKFTSACKITAQDGSTLATISAEYTFAGGTFSGTTINAALPPLVKAACDATYKDTGQKL